MQDEKLLNIKNLTFNADPEVLEKVSELSPLFKSYAVKWMNAHKENFYKPDQLEL